MTEQFTAAQSQISPIFSPLYRQIKALLLQSLEQG